MFKIYFVNSAYEKDQVLMYDDTRDDDYLKLGNPKLHIEVNAAGTLDFELPSTNVAYSRIIPMVTELHVIKDNQKTHDKHIWFGRVLTIDTDLYRTKTIHCEGGLAYLNDCIYYDKSVDHGSWSNQKIVGRAIFARYESPTLNEGGVHVYGVSPNEASAVIANIMSGGSNYKENLNAPFKHLGRIAKDTDSDVPIYAWVNEPVIPSGDQTDEDYYFYEDILNSTGQNQCGISNPNNMTAIDLISSMMSNVGGLFWVSKTPQYPKRTFGGANLGDAVYVMQLHMRRYYPAFNPDEGQTIQLGENLTDLTVTDDGTTFFTAVHPHGQRVNSGEDFTLDHRGSQGGTTYINKRNWKIDPEHGVMYCPELVKQYGMIIRDLDVGTSNIYDQLVGMGISEIDRIPIISKTVGGNWTSGVRELTVKGIDMSLYNADYSSIELTDAVRVLAPRHGIDTYLNVTAIDYDLQNVENTVFTLNAIKSSNEITNASPSYGSSSGPQSSGSSYVHPKHTEHNLGLYKFSNDNLGHVDSAVAVSKKDITALGIPDKDTNTTYELSKTGNTITLTGSDGTSSSVLDSDTRYQLVGYYNRIFTDGPVVALEDPNRNHSIVHVPNTFTSIETNIQFEIGRYANIGDSYKVILDLAFFAPNSYGYGMGTDISGYRDYPVIINSYITLHFGESSTKRFLVQIITSARSDMTIVPARAIVRQLDSDSEYSNMRWKVFLGYTDDTARKGLVTAIRICLPSDTCSDVTGIESKTFTYLATSILGDFIERPRIEINTYDIATTEIDTILELSSQNASNVAFTGDYNDLSNKPTIPDISGKQDKLTAGANITISGNTISAKDTTYTSKSAVSGGTDVSLVTTGEKAIWNAKTSNVGTITGIKMNGASKGTSGVVDLGTVITAHQDISGKQDKSTAVTHTANTAVGSTAKPVYIAADGKATPITHSVNSDVPSNAKFTDTVYTHPTASGNKHIPSGGSSGQILRWSSDGTAAWGADNNTTYNDATQSTHGLMTAADKKKLDEMDLSKYLPKSGGVMAGDIDMQTNKKDILVGTHKATTSDGTAVAGGSITTAGYVGDKLKAARSFIGTVTGNDGVWWDAISVRHRNGYTDGVNYGMYLISKLSSTGNLLWNKQTANNTWQGERTLLDSINYSNYAAPLSHTHKNIDSIGNVGYYGSDAASTNGWYKFHSGTLTGYNDRTARLMLTYMYGYNNFGTIFFHARCNNGNTIQIQRLLWEVRSGFEDGDVVAVAKGNDYSLYVYNRNPQWGRIKIRVLESGGTSSAWDMTLASNFTKESTAPTPTIVASDGCTVANATTWNGLINDVDTYNSSDTWILVKKDNRIQHRYAGELDVNSAKTLVDSGWSSVTTYVVDKSKFNNISTEFRRIGQIAWVKCSFTPNVAMTNITICDVVNVDPFVAVTPANTVFGVGSASDGSESFIASISYNPDPKLRLRGNFKPSTIYRLMFSYPVT